jgi:hypothetical protein
MKNRIYFNEEEHKYTNKEGEVYTSATTLVGKFKKKFDTESEAIAYAKRHPYLGLSSDDVTELWDNERERACEKGTKFHKEQEILAYEEGEIQWKDMHLYVRNYNEFIEKDNFDPYLDLPDGLYPELLLWNHNYKIAGQADMVYIYTINGERYIDIDDYKTNKKINTVSWYHRSTKEFEMMKRPLSHLMDCNYIHYNLQLSIYAWMLEQWGFKINDIQFTHHWKDEFWDLYRVQPYPLEYRKKEINDILLTL